jgi:hypothetical protein
VPACLNKLYVLNYLCYLRVLVHHDLSYFVLPMEIFLLNGKPHGFVEQVNVVDVEQVRLALKEIMDRLIELLHKASFGLKYYPVKLVDAVGQLQMLRHSVNYCYFFFNFCFLLFYVVKLLV